MPRPRWDLAVDRGLFAFALWLDVQASRLERRAATRAQHGQAGARLARRAVVLRSAASLLKGVG